LIFLGKHSNIVLYKISNEKFSGDNRWILTEFEIIK